MIASVSGTLTYKGTETALVDNHGLEWELHTSSRSLEALPSVGSEVHVFTHLHHRDDQMKLYGFASREERNLFLDLLRVDGVGPRLVLKILSGIGSEELAQALEAGDLHRLTQIPGLGTKTAQKMILALKGKLTLDGGVGGSAATGAAGQGGGVEADLTAALVKMGFGQRESREAVQGAIHAAQADGAEGRALEEQVLRMAAAQLSALTTGE